MAYNKRGGGSPSYTLHIPFDPVTWPKVRDLAATRKQSMEMLAYLAILKELDSVPAETAPEPEGRSIDVSRWPVFNKSGG